MYKSFYQLEENPFSVTADPEFFFSSIRHSEAFSHIIYGITERKGILVVTGEIGTGKTTIIRTLMSRLDESVKTALILNPNFSDVQLLRLIVHDLGIEGKFRNKYELIDALNQFLIQTTNEGSNVVLIIDEAQNLGVKQLEQVRLLSNLETDKQKLLQIVLVGQPELLEKLKLPSLRQLNQRVGVRYHILPLDREELGTYITHRIRIASQKTLSHNINFTDEAVDMIYENSKGTPRMINILCDRALLAGFASETYKIDKHIVHKCVQEIVTK